VIDETKLLDMSDEELLRIVKGNSPTNLLWQGAKAALEVRNAKRMSDSAIRMEVVTYVIAAATIVQLVLGIIEWVRH